MISDDTPVFVISVAAELSGMHPQTLRQYDRLGLVTPGRSGGGGRRYSSRDVALLREVQRLSQEEGVNLAGIKRVIELENQVEALQARLQELAEQLAATEAALGARPRHRHGVPAAGPRAGARLRARGLEAAGALTSAVTVRDVAGRFPGKHFPRGRSGCNLRPLAHKGVRMNWG